MPPINPFEMFIEQDGGVKPSCGTLIAQEPLKPVDEFLTDA
jgi:hypothetical protein